MAAISPAHENQSLQSLVKDSRVQKLIKGTTRHAAEDKEFVPEKDLLPLAALKEWIHHKPPSERKAVDTKYCNNCTGIEMHEKTN